MNGGRITSEEKASLQNYIGVGIVVILALGGLYFFFFARQAAKDVTGFDPNRPVPTDAVLKRRISAEEYHIVREGGTQVPMQNEFWNNWKTGLYVDVITGEPLFTSLDKYDAGLGMPTFSKPISKDLLAEYPDTSFGMQRTEVRAKRSNAHLGHLFRDEKSPTGERYTLNSACFNFIPVERLKAMGYESYQGLFDKK